MPWHATADQTLLVEGVLDRAWILAAISSFEAEARDDARGLGSSLRDALAVGIIPASALIGLGRACHREGPARDAARDVSRALFGLVLPTPLDGGDLDFFWRVARALTRQEAAPTAPSRAVTFRTFHHPQDAADFATRVSPRLVTLTEGISAGESRYTVWYWEG
jgi:hypothetical protein